MAMLALDSAYRRVSVEEFLAMDFGGARAELDDGLIYMMAGGNEVHARIAANLVIALGTRLRGSGCRPYGSDFAVRTREQSIRFPDVSVYCDNPSRPENNGKQLIGDPKVVFEVLSASTAAHDQKDKQNEYRARDGIAAIVFVDPQSERIRIVQRTGPNGWKDDWLEPGADLPLTAVNITLPHAEIFTRD